MPTQIYECWWVENIYRNAGWIGYVLGGICWGGITKMGRVSLLPLANDFITITIIIIIIININIIINA